MSRALTVTTTSGCYLRNKELSSLLLARQSVANVTLDVASVLATDFTYRSVIIYR